MESSVKYIKRTFLPPRDLRDLTSTNTDLWAWLLADDGNRVHGTAHERPLSRFTQTEQAFLKPLPSPAPVLATWTRVKLHPDCHNVCACPVSSTR